MCQYICPHMAACRLTEIGFLRYDFHLFWNRLQSIKQGMGESQATLNLRKMVLLWNNSVWTNSQLLISYDCATSIGLHHDHHCHHHSCLHKQLSSNYLAAWHTMAELPRMGNEKERGGRRRSRQEGEWKKGRRRREKAIVCLLPIQINFIWKQLHNNTHLVSPAAQSEQGLGYELDDQKNGMGANFSLHQGVQPCSGTHAASCPMVSGALSLQVQHLEHVANQSPSICCWRLRKPKSFIPIC